MTEDETKTYLIMKSGSLDKALVECIFGRVEFSESDKKILDDHLNSKLVDHQMVEVIIRQRKLTK